MKKSDWLPTWKGIEMGGEVLLERKTLENVPFSDKRNFNQTNQWNFQILAKSYTRFPTKETIFFSLHFFVHFLEFIPV